MSEKLPVGWQYANLDQVSSSFGGGTPSKADSTYWVNGSIPWVSPKDMKSFVVSGSEDCITHKALERLPIIPQDSVLVVVRSGILSRTLPVAVTVLPVTVNQDMRAFVPFDGISAEYLAWQLIARENQILSACAKDGTTVASVESGALSRFPLTIAPAAEQVRIVTKLKEVFSDLEVAVAELEFAKKKLSLYRQSLLMAAMEGELTAEWREGIGQENQNSVSLDAVLLERRFQWENRQLLKAKIERRELSQSWKKKYQEHSCIIDKELYGLPFGWLWATVDQLSPNDLANGRSVPSAEIGAKVLRLTAVRNGIIDLAAAKCGAWTEEEAVQFAVAEGDLLIVRGNGSLSLVGRMGLVRRVTEQVAYPDTLIRLKVLNNIVRPAWVALVWNSGIVRQHLEKRARTSAGIYKISQPDILSVPVPVPPLDEQDRIIERYEAFDQQIKMLELVLEKSLVQAAAQRQNILRAAFSGRLVPQDPNDEPASELLERIRAEKEKAGKETKAKKFRAPRKAAAEPQLF